MEIDNKAKLKAEKCQQFPFTILSILSLELLKILFRPLDAYLVAFCLF